MVYQSIWFLSRHISFAPNHDFNLSVLYTSTEENLSFSLTRSWLSSPMITLPSCNSSKLVSRTSGVVSRLVLRESPDTKSFTPSHVPFSPQRIFLSFVTTTVCVSGSSVFCSFPIYTMSFAFAF